MPSNGKETLENSLGKKKQPCHKDKEDEKFPEETPIHLRYK